MKILICGKGGCGKSTIATLLAKELAASIHLENQFFWLRRYLNSTGKSINL